MKNFQLSLISRVRFNLEVDKMLSENPSQPLYVSITKKEKKRGLSANAQQHLWYKQIADFHGDRSALEVKSMCKDMFGLPILLNSAEHGEKIEFLLHKLDYYKHGYDSKMKLIQCLSVTSEFNSKESKEYMDDMIFYFNDVGIPIGYQD